MNYADARSQIQNGDCISVIGREGISAPLTRFFTGKYTHSGIAIWMEGGLWMFELNSGHNHLVPLSQLEQTDFDVFYPPVPSRSQVREEVLKELRNKVAYSLPAFIVIGLLEWLKLRVFVHARRELVCSGVVVKVYEACGWPERSRIISPTRLAEQLTLKLSVRHKDCLT